MRVTDIGTLPKFFDRYITLVEDVDLMSGLVKYQSLFTNDEYEKVVELGDKVYAKDKWTIREIVQHSIDNERVQSYRALRFSRGDMTILPGYDEDLLAAGANANDRSLDALLQEFEVVRRSSLLLFSSMTEDQMLIKGNANAIEISSLALGFQIIGHQIHHKNVINNRYFPLLDQ